MKESVYIPPSIAMQIPLMVYIKETCGWVELIKSLDERPLEDQIKCNSKLNNVEQLLLVTITMSWIPISLSLCL